MTDQSMDNTHPSPSRSQVPEAELKQLRSLLLGPDVEARLRATQVRSEDVSRVLPDAIILSHKAQEDLTTEAVVPTVETAIKSSVHKDQHILSEALFPIIGPATRKAVAVALQDFTQTLNQGLDQSFSPKSLRWRFEAWRTGQSFAEIVILHTLLYRVEQVFLIHKDTGLLLQHLVDQQTTVQDPDLVSAMFTAIQDFVRDSFKINKSSTLKTLEYGELNIWIEEGPHALIAAVIRGNAPPEIRLVLQQNLEKIHLILGKELAAFQGDNAPFLASQPYLEDCLQGQFKPQKKSIPPLAIIGVPLLCLLGYWAFTNWQDSQQWGIYVRRLESAPGIMVRKHYRQNGQYYLQGMRDPEAIDPHDRTLLQNLKLDPKRIILTWEPYWSFHPKLVEARAQDLLEPPEEVTLEVTPQQILKATGVADQGWRAKFLQSGPQIAGVVGVNTQQLASQEEQAMQALKQKIEGLNLLFPTGRNRLTSQQDQSLQDLIAHSKELIQLAKKIKKNVIINIDGYTDSVGTEQSNFFLSQARANFIRNQLIANNIPLENLKVNALGDQRASQDEGQPDPDPKKRKVSLTVDIQG